MSLFIETKDLRKLTGFAHHKKQIEQLHLLGIPFIVNGRGQPVVAITVINGKNERHSQTQKWSSSVLSVIKN